MQIYKFFPYYILYTELNNTPLTIYSQNNTYNATIEQIIDFLTALRIKKSTRCGQLHSKIETLSVYEGALFFTIYYCYLCTV